MRTLIFLAAGILACPSAASAQEMSVDEMIRSIHRTAGTEARSGDAAPSNTRTFTIENGVDDRTGNGRRPADVVAPPPPRPVPSPVASNPATCTVALNFNLILFDRGSARISADDQTQKTLGALTTALVTPENAHVRFFVRGHTDATGSFETNLRLSQARAEAVAQRLIVGGVRADRVQARGMATTMPIDATDLTSFKNRRVDICI
ncbi:OmpA family protein [Sphingomonas sp. CJ20]